MVQFSSPFTLTDAGIINDFAVAKDREKCLAFEFRVCVGRYDLKVLHA